MKYFIFGSLLFLGISFFSLNSVHAVAECDPAKYKLEAGVCIPIGTGLAGLDEPKPVWKVLDTFLLWILSLVAALAIIAFAISGIMYLTSAGNENQIDTAKRYMLWSIVGTIVAMSGLIILMAVDNWLKGGKSF